MNLGCLRRLGCARSLWKLDLICKILLELERVAPADTSNSLKPFDCLHDKSYVEDIQEEPCFTEIVALE